MYRNAIRHIDSRRYLATVVVSMAVDISAKEVPMAEPCCPPKADCPENCCPPEEPCC